MAALVLLSVFSQCLYFVLVIFTCFFPLLLQILSLLNQETNYESSVRKLPTDKNRALRTNHISETLQLASKCSIPRPHWVFHIQSQTHLYCLREITVIFERAYFSLEFSSLQQKDILIQAYVNEEYNDQRSLRQRQSSLPCGRQQKVEKGDRKGSKMGSSFLDITPMIYLL